MSAEKLEHGSSECEDTRAGVLGRAGLGAEDQAGLGAQVWGAG